MELIAHFNSWNSYAQGRAEYPMVKLRYPFKTCLPHKLVVSWFLMSTILPPETKRGHNLCADIRKESHAIIVKLYVLYNCTKMYKSALLRSYPEMVFYGNRDTSFPADCDTG